jgi:ribonuclease D
MVERGAAEHDGVMEALRAWRRDEARRRDAPAFTILHDRTIAALASARPSSPAALLDVHGIGPAKADAFGAAILRVIADALAGDRTG